MCPANPGKSWNFILAFSRTEKSWKSINFCKKKVFFEKNFLDLYFVRVYCFNYCGYLSPGEVLENCFWKRV